MNNFTSMRFGSSGGDGSEHDGVDEMQRVLFFGSGGRRLCGLPLGGARGTPIVHPSPQPIHFCRGTVRQREHLQHIVNRQQEESETET